jgi:hypothetical protein
MKLSLEGRLCRGHTFVLPVGENEALTPGNLTPCRRKRSSDPGNTTSQAVGVDGQLADVAALDCHRPADATGEALGFHGHRQERFPVIAHVADQEGRDGYRFGEARSGMPGSHLRSSCWRNRSSDPGNTTMASLPTLPRLVVFHATHGKKIRPPVQSGCPTQAQDREERQNP